MSKRTKLILSIIGLSAIIIPAILLKVLTVSTKEPSGASQNSRSLDTKAVQEAVKKKPVASISPNVNQASGSAFQASPSATPQ
ncbi:hypothetical protein A2697_03650 [Candidatus Curtissbacteria bacterium RIFCSPHIGHO2_01_FULL_41_44]|uniref:Uncharacterized protein n=1 Tax=Candidatus Curtissbacteria bacterium RIFCSPLOWO2_01_FULL_42_50 TaxID=1797730 RepID=A0A1F5H7H9_9BACT|nr:MAG: hypothetical protein A2697_03650 [Candidatus Curtissbacteria bacterium RIFCSPHIGHO2_01_FULL_41_44]OGE00127.1 MAG: hypothetical protein A3B54_01865 [Candidatus Curtissbacteria bacterium RIFCSPLOWO2_01_FULL_42_50]OGE02053.1 MAG: hypothetical protein A3G16_00175 [Candidatus Curtissbacteria bacterium RIFCSPLOWO2_12_FULL_41_16]OGE09784.1 MAG: hypothetical protein A3H87_02565 [Candidatus Curtissbacteria bacterium RIFCSPLOWO2_02_FULL_42_37]